MVSTVKYSSSFRYYNTCKYSLILKLKFKFKNAIVNIYDPLINFISNDLQNVTSVNPIISKSKNLTEK